MNVFTVVVTGSIVCSLAYAAHQGRPVSAQPDGAGNRSVTHEELVPGQRPKGHAMAALGGGGDCTIGEPLNWFTTPRPLPACFTIRSMHYKDAEDINRDGEAEFIDYVGGVVLSVAGVAQPGGCVAYITQTNWDGEEVVLTRHCVASSESVSSYTADRFPDQTVATYFDSGLRDIDKDGDLDLVLMLDMQAPPHYPYYVWLENTGYEASNGLAADINQDGVVDGKDLAAVLAGWTP